MAQNVYYGFNRLDDGRKISELLSMDLEPLLPDVKKQLHSSEDPALKTVYKCYATHEEMRNTFIYRAPMDLDIEYNDDKTEVTLGNVDYGQEHQYKPFFYVDSINLMQFFAGCGLLLIAEQKSLPFSIHPANYHKTGVSGLTMIKGSFDCGKWYRPINFSVINTDHVNFSIKRGDPLFYVKFHTDDNVCLHRVHTTDKMKEISEASIDFKFYAQKSPLKKLYQAFSSSKMKSVLMREIKADKTK